MIINLKQRINHRSVSTNFILIKLHVKFLSQIHVIYSGRPLFLRKILKHSCVYKISLRLTFRPIRIGKCVRIKCVNTSARKHYIHIYRMDKWRIDGASSDIAFCWFWNDIYNDGIRFTRAGIEAADAGAISAWNQREH